MKKKFLLAIPVAVAIILAYYVMSNEKNQQTAITTQKLAQNGSPLLGHKDASITVVEWGDYQCTYCHLFH